MVKCIYMQEAVEVKHPKWRNDRLIKDANNALNLLIKKGYLERSGFGFRGWVREVDGTTCKLVINTKDKGTLICALLRLYFPDRIIKEVK